MKKLVWIAGLLCLVVGGAYGRDLDQQQAEQVLFAFDDHSIPCLCAFVNRTV